MTLADVHPCQNLSQHHMTYFLRGRGLPFEICSLSSNCHLIGDSQWNLPNTTLPVGHLVGWGADWPSMVLAPHPVYHQPIVCDVPLAMAYSLVEFKFRWVGLYHAFGHLHVSCPVGMWYVSATTAL